MPVLSPTWNTRRVFITYRNALSGALEAGKWSAKSDVRIVNTLDDGKKQVFRPTNLGTGTLNTNEGSPSLSLDLPIVDDPENSPNGGQITLQIDFTSGGSEVFKLSPLLEWPEVGVDLAVILNPAIVPAAPPFMLKGIPGGVAELDSEGFVIDAFGSRVVGGETGTVTWTSISGKPVIIAAGATQDDARAAIAVPSLDQFNDAIDLTVNVSTYTSGMASKADLVDGFVPTTQIPSIDSSKISNFSEAAQDAISTLLAGTSGVTLSYNDAANTLTITGPGASGLDAEAVRDAIGIAMVGTGVISVAVNDAADTITISSTATANATDAALRDRSTHTGTQSADTVVDGTTNKVYTATEKTKLSGIATSATANDTDANLKNRANHTGTQTASTISNFTTTVETITGVLTSLTTTVKTSLVAAINELMGEITLLWTNANRKQDLCRWDDDARTWEARGAGWRFGVMFLSTNDPTADAPLDLNKKYGDIWRAHPDQTPPA